MTYKSFAAVIRHKALLPALATLLLLLLGARAHANEAHDGVILVWGDSLSAAYRMEEPQGWVALLENRLAEEGLPWRVVNGSVSGETTAGGLARLPAMLESTQPDIVILELGGNDGLRGLPVPAMRTNLTRMIELSMEAGARVLLAGIQIPPNYGPRYTGPFYAQYSELAEQYGLTLIPFLLQGIAEDPANMQEDGIHPTAESQPMVLDNVWPALLSLIKSGRH